MYTQFTLYYVLYQRTRHIELYSVDQSEPVPEPSLPRALHQAVQGSPVKRRSVGWLVHQPRLDHVGGGADERGDEAARQGRAFRIYAVSGLVLPLVYKPSFL